MSAHLFCNLSRSFANCGFALVVVICLCANAHAQKKHVPPGGHVAIVADARLAALRSAPTLGAPLMRRLNRGRLVSIRGSRRNSDGVLFYKVVINRRTSGWVQSDAVVASWNPRDPERLFHLITGPDEFERVARSRIFLETFQHSPRRPAVLLIYSQAAEEAAEKLSREAAHRLERSELPSDGAPEFTYFLNYSGLDRYNRQGVRFVFDKSTRTFHYDGAALAEILRRYPQSNEAEEARKMLAKLDAIKTRS